MVVEGAAAAAEAAARMQMDDLAQRVRPFRIGLRTSHLFQNSVLSDPIT